MNMLVGVWYGLVLELNCCLMVSVIDMSIKVDMLAEDIIAAFLVWSWSRSLFQILRKKELLGMIEV